MTATTTQRGLGWNHQQNRRYLIANLINGTLCWWCALPMFKTAAANWDRAELEADHSLARAHGGHRADRLLHRTCNRQRKDGSLDHLRPAISGIHPSQWTAAIARQLHDKIPTDHRRMPWPW